MLPADESPVRANCIARVALLDQHQELLVDALTEPNPKTHSYPY